MLVAVELLFVTVPVPLTVPLNASCTSVSIDPAGSNACTAALLNPSKLTLAVVDPAVVNVNVTDWQTKPVPHKNGAAETAPGAQAINAAAVRPIERGLDMLPPDTSVGRVAEKFCLISCNSHAKRYKRLFLLPFDIDAQPTGAGSVKFSDIRCRGPQTAPCRRETHRLMMQAFDWLSFTGELPARLAGNSLVLPRIDPQKSVKFTDMRQT